MPYCDVEPSVRLYYEDFGCGRPLLFIHGGGMSHEMWEQQAYELADHFRVITVDLRGHGQSDKPAHGHTFERFVQDTAALVQHIAVAEPINLICHGIGGYVGMLYVLTHPEAVARLVLVSSGARFVGADDERGGFSPELWDTYSSGMAKNKVAATTELVERTFFHRDPGQTTRLAAINIMLQWPVYAMKMLGRDLQGIDLEGRLSEIRVPTLVIHGVHDRKQRFSGALHLASKIAGAKMMAFEDSAHNPQLEEVEKFNRALLDFVA